MAAAHALLLECARGSWAMVTRREFMGMSAAIGGAVLLRPLMASAAPLELPLGLQLYSVRDQLAKNFDATLMEVGKLGYREVEAAGFYGRSATEIREAMKRAGLHCVSSHTPYADLRTHFDEILAYAQAVGVGYLICSSPGRKTPGSGDAKLTLEDWRWNAGEFNRLGEACKAVGIQFGYHNHIAESEAIDGVVPYDELMRLTDPAKVTMEMDCGWVIVGGGNPVALLKKYPGRVSMLHVKDFKNIVPGSGEQTAAELGHGSIAYEPIFAQAAKTQSIKHIFVEQEQFYKPYAESLKMDAEYLSKLI
jgi:sugar phosphate isomerase/epimerase